MSKFGRCEWKVKSRKVVIELEQGNVLELINSVEKVDPK